MVIHVFTVTVKDLLKLLLLVLSALGHVSVFERKMLLKQPTFDCTRIHL